MGALLTMRIEIAGPAGSGKSTLTHLLADDKLRILDMDVPSTDKIEYTPFFLKSFLYLLPGYLTLPKQGDRKLTRRELAWLMVLSGWSDTLLKSSNGTTRALVIDQGPIFLLTSLYNFGPSWLRADSSDPFWQPILAKWARTLDMIVFLDASNECLYQRIINRSKKHIMKNETPNVVNDFLDQWRSGYEVILQRISRQSPCPRVFRIDSGNVPIDRIYRLVKMEIINFGTNHDQNT